MDSSEHEVYEPRPEPLPSSYGWQRRLVATIVGGIVIVGIVWLMVIVSERAGRPPRLVYPASVQATMDARMETLKIDRSGNRPVSDEMLKSLVKAYGLEDCQVGRKYGALCQDGTVEQQARPFEEDQLGQLCSEHGGVKEWIECRWLLP